MVDVTEENKRPKMYKKSGETLPGKLGILSSVVIGVLLIANIFTFYLYRKEVAARPAIDSCHSDYSFINPHLRCEDELIINKKGYVEFRSKLKNFIDEKKSQGEVDSVGVWFRDLEFGPTFGVNQFEDFIPASLLKLPLAITFLNLAENDPGLLKKTIIYPNNLTETPNQTFVPSEPMEIGKAYTIDELTARAVSYSDNHAAQMLYDYMLKNYPDNPLSRTYRDLGILEPGVDLDKADVNAKGYGSIFRLLYNISFLNKDSSEKLLALLAATDFQDGLQGGVPEGVKIAHKFGERFLENGKKQLHDCGIIYYPGNPYELCVMTRGDDFNNLENIISQISKMTYEEFDSRKL